MTYYLIVVVYIKATIQEMKFFSKLTLLPMRDIVFETTRFQYHYENSTKKIIPSKQSYAFIRKKESA